MTPSMVRIKMSSHHHARHAAFREREEPRTQQAIMIHKQQTHEAGMRIARAHKHAAERWRGPLG